MDASSLADDDYVEDDEEAAQPSCLGCFSGFCFRSQYCASRYDLLHHQPEDKTQNRLVERLKRLKVKEFSEIQAAAGPKWKNFIRSCRVHGKNKKRQNRFYYDPQSYALNFEDGIEKEVDVTCTDFRARYGSSGGETGLNKEVFGNFVAVSS